MLSKTILSAALAVSMAIMSGGWATGSSAEGFQLDVTFEELTRAQEEILVSDLRVGDAALIRATGVAFCGDGNGLFILGDRQIISESDTFTVSIEVRRIPSRMVDIEIISPAGNSAALNNRFALSFLREAQSCEFKRLTKSNLLDDEDFEVFEVNTINGYHSASDLLAGR